MPRDTWTTTDDRILRVLWIAFIACSVFAVFCYTMAMIAASMPEDGRRIVSERCYYADTGETVPCPPLSKEAP